jgi:protein-tyrosine phosphatase
MHTEPFWIPTRFPGRFGIAPRPRGGDWLDDEMRGWREAGIDLVISMLTPEEAVEFDLASEATQGIAHDLRFVSFPVPDRDVPESRTAFRDLVNGVVRELSAGHSVAIHCRQGIGRAAITALGVLIAGGLDPESAIARVSAARGRPVPETPAQRRWLDEYAADKSFPAPAV